jgi:DNA-binding NarL/FixJ family response regulator
MTDAAPIRVLIADDQALIRVGFRLVLEAEDDLEVVAEAGDGQEATDLAVRLRPDVVLMDVRMPILDGIAATALIARFAPDTRVLVLTTFDLDEYVLSAIGAGASGFLLKDATPEELVAAVRVVAAGDALLAPSVTRRLIEDFARSAPPPRTSETRLAGLTEREREVLVLVGRGMSNAEIASALFIAEQTVKTHVSKILQKLGLRDRVHAVVLAYDTGLVTPGA